jgi:hypothetical protein
MNLTNEATMQSKLAFILLSLDRVGAYWRARRRQQDTVLLSSDDVLGRRPNPNLHSMPELQDNIERVLVACSLWLHIGLIGASAIAVGLLQLFDGEARWPFALALAISGGVLAAVSWRSGLTVLERADRVQSSLPMYSPSSPVGTRSPALPLLRAGDRVRTLADGKDAESDPGDCCVRVRQQPHAEWHRKRARREHGPQRQPLNDQGKSVA